MRRGGFTLIEVLMAVLILAGGLTALLTSVSKCLELISSAREVREVQYVFDLAEAAHPIGDELLDDVEKKVPVSPDSSLAEGYVFERIVLPKTVREESEDDDKLYVVRSIVSWERGGKTEEVDEYVRQK